MAKTSATTKPRKGSATGRAAKVVSAEKPRSHQTEVVQKSHPSAAAQKPRKEEPLVLLKGLTIRCKGQELVRDIRLSIPKGKVTCVIGESGSGKSLTARVLAGLLPEGMTHTVETHTFAGQDCRLWQQATWQKNRGKNIAFVLQNPSSCLNPIHTIYVQMDEVLTLHSTLSRAERRERIAEALEKVGLGQLGFGKGRYPYELSGGQKQRVAIAMAMLMNPALIIADEPTSALDAHNQKVVLDLLLKMVKENGLTLLLITHNFGDVLYAGHQVNVMYKGEIVESGAVKKVFAAPMHAHTKELVAATPMLNTKQRKAPQGDEVLCVNDLYKSVKQKPLLQGVSLDVKEGEVIGIVGPSGCGKSTLARCIAGLESYDGKVHFAKRFIKGASPVQMVFQDPLSALNPRLKVRTSILEALYHLPLNRAEKEQKMHHLLEAVGLPQEAAEKYPYMFSGGQQQRLAIARALIAHPALLIADEATSALDMTVQKTILDLFDALRKSFNLSMIYIAHDIRIVSERCDRVLVMDEGRVIEEGRVDKVLKNPQTAFTQMLVETARAESIAP